MDQHPLRIWIAANTSQVRFARAIGCSPAYLSMVLAGKKQPSLRLAVRMSRTTGGAVPVEAFVVDEEGQAVNAA